MIDLTDGHLLMIVFVMIEDHLVEVGETGKEIEIGTGIPEIDLPLGSFLIEFYLIIKLNLFILDTCGIKTIFRDRNSYTSFYKKNWLTTPLPLKGHLYFAAEDN